MDLNHPLLQAGDSDPIPFPDSHPQLQRLDRAVCCPICKELYKAPVTITCGHSFCSQCIRSYLDASATKKCPECNEVAKEGAIRKNRVLEELTDAWEDARPTLLELTQPPRKRARESNGPFSSKRPRKAEEEDGDDEIEFTGGSNASGEELSESDEAPCPLCGAHMLISAINGHIDRGCPPPKPKASTSASGNQKADWKKVFSGAGSSKGKEVERKRIVKPNYSLTSTSELRALLAQHSLSTTGDRPVLEARFQEWTVLYNASIDSSHPPSLGALRAQLNQNEAARKRDKERSKGVDAETLQTAEGIKRHAKDQAKEFERLRQDILDRKKKKGGSGAESPIEIE